MSKQYEKALAEAFSHKYRLFYLFKDYERFVETELYPEPLIRDHAFYKALRTLVAREKSPIYNRVDDAKEQYTYLGCDYISPMPNRVDRYANDAIFTKFIVHENTHQLFSYVRNVTGMSLKEFYDSMSRAERAASNESEVLIYFRIPQLREKTREILPRIWYDCLVEGEYDLSKITLSHLEAMRAAWLDNDIWDDIFAPGPENEPVRAYMGRFRGSNEDFLYERLRALRKLPALSEPTFVSLLPGDYEHPLNDYAKLLEAEHNSSYALLQEKYERNVLVHIQLLYMLVGRLDYPRTFDEIFERWDETDNFTPFL